MNALEISDRIKNLRNSLNLTQTEFGNKIGFKQNTVGQMENGLRGITDRTILLICQTFNVNEEWLRTGDGEMFKDDDDILISQLAKQYNLDDFSRRFIKTYVKLPEEKRALVKEFAYSIIAGRNTDMEVSEELSPISNQNHVFTESDIDAEVESYRKELELEKSIRTSSASHDGEKIG